MTATHVGGSVTHKPVVSFIRDRVARSPSDGLHQRQLPTENLHQLAMCGAMASSCGKSCPTEKGLTGICPIKM